MGHFDPDLMRTYQKQYGGPSPPSCLSLGWGDLVSRIESNMPFCACVCPWLMVMRWWKPGQRVFVWKRIHSMFLGLPSTLLRWAFSSKTLRFENALEVGQNENTYISCRCGRSKTHQNENNDRKYRRRVCWLHGHGVKIKSQRAILSFLNVLVLVVENASKR